MQNTPNVDPAPPPITIVDPNAPPIQADVLESGSDPRLRLPTWRPRPKHVVIGLVLVVAVTGAALLVRDVRDDQAQRRIELALDRAAMSAVSLSAHLDGNFYPENSLRPVLTLQIENDGPDPVQVSAVRLDDTLLLPGAASRLDPGATAPYTFPTPSTCAKNAGRVSSYSIRVEVITVRGSRLTRELRVSAEDLEATNTNERERCGTQLPADAFSADFGRPHVSHGWVVVPLHVANVSVLPLSLTRWQAPEGLSLRAPEPPLTFQPRPADGYATPVDVRLSLKVKDCHTWHDGSHPFRLQAGLHGRFEDGTAQIPIARVGYGEGPDVFSLLADSCKGVVDMYGTGGG